MEKRFHLNPRAAVLAGVIAGTLFLILELAMVPVFAGGSPWGPPRMIAAIILGQGVLPPPATFDLGIVLAAMAVHYVLSILYAFLFALVVGRMGLGLGLLLGAIGGFALYVVNFYGFTAIFPWFAMARNWISIFAHIVFGVATAWVYLALSRPHIPGEPAHTWKHREV